jgi:hypothetical protein
VTVDLVIAGRRIRLCSREGVSIQPDERFSAFTVPSDVRPYMFIDSTPGIFTDADPGIVEAAIPFMPAETWSDLVVDVEPGPGEITAGAVKVFDAQLMEETSAGARNTGEPFWEVFRDDEAVRARVFLKDPERNAILEMPHGKRQWRIFTGEGWSSQGSVSGGTPGQHQDKTSDGKVRDLSSERDSAISLNPLSYPLDGLLLYFLFSRAGDIMIHGSGVVAGDRGWLFTGRSGSGKTTLARLFDGAGDRVIHDDRLVLRREGTGWVMHSTPVYRNDEPRTAPLDHLWVIRHGAANVSEPVAGAEAVAMIMANCIQQNWDGEAAARLAAAADDLVAAVPVSRLSFLPDGTVRDYLLLRATEEKIIAAGAVSEMLGEGHAVTLTAGGYSMWPAIKPGDRVRISPPAKENTPAKGTVVALLRDGGFVVHRVTDVRRAGPADQIRTRGDTSPAADPWINAGDIAGLVTLVTAKGDAIPVPHRRFPYLAGSLAATAAKIWNRIAGRK